MFLIFSHFIAKDSQNHFNYLLIFDFIINYFFLKFAFIIKFFKSVFILNKFFYIRNWFSFSSITSRIINEFTIILSIIYKKKRLI